ncbi:helix-turn-helix transcriptional regulator [Actinoplanes couchii]|uniref:Transcriptional regulator n=1 Tax=Actinoplanes couchii TaxID=403638 RepID=A0ABQ3XL47_9ACTN|nr:helix-turn-helix transcriptional regulator [Actinoplanes couchii]MDR6318416.1 transcriptional regulator with XRE-family HTH domain [Actinoplanes couchii]GID59218.1 transcriptional regulator [Actinoplanes couchii]
MTNTNQLGQFLRARRAQVEPAAAGLFPGGDRRVPGLRREEVAVLAGVSADYYARLEQGRERHPSPQILDALARTFRFDTDTRAHLYRLAGLTTGLVPAPAGDIVHPALLTLMDAFPHAAAYVLGPAFDVLAANRPGAALLAPFGPRPNMVRVLFTDPLARTFFDDWPFAADAVVHALRLNAGLLPNHPAIRTVRDDLAGCPDFTTRWDRQGVGALLRTGKTFHHPAEGRLDLTYQTFDVRDAPGQQLQVGTFDHGTRTCR